MTLDDNPLETNDDLQRFIADLKSQNNSSANSEKNITHDSSINDVMDSSQSNDSVRSGNSQRESISEIEENQSFGEASKSGKQLDTLNPDSLLIGKEDKKLNPKTVEDHFWEKQFKADDDTSLTDNDIQHLEKKLAAQAEQLQNINLLSGLPQEGLFAPNGKSIYEMEPATLNSYLLQLKSNGQESLVAEVQEAYNTALNRIQNYISQKTLLSQKQETLKEKKHFNEWRSVRDEWLSKFPEVSSHLNQLAQYIEKKAGSDPTFELQISSQAGKMRAVLQVIKELGIDKTLAAQEPRIQMSMPASPESQTASKKVSNQTGMSETFTAEQISKMSMQEYLKHEADIDKQLAKKLIK